MPDLLQIQSVVNALGWTLIHFLWQGFALACIYWTVCRFLSPERATIRYWTGMLAFLAAAVIPVVTFVFYWQTTLIQAGSEQAVAVMAPVASAMNLSFTQILQLSLEPAIPVVVVLWALGVVFLSIRAVMGWMGVQRLVNTDTEEVSTTLQQVVQRLMKQLGMSHAVRVLKSGRVLVPTVVGWLKPVILLPAAVIAQLPEDQLEMVIAHELGHIRRYDYLFNILQLVVETLFFYNPAIRWMSRQVRQEREHCCDDLVVAQCGRPVLYARALANLEVLREPLPAVALSASGGDLVHRVRRIIQHELPGHNTGFAQLTTMLGVALLVSASAYQGIEMQRNLVENSTSAEVEQVSRSAYDTQSRSGWVQGIEGYSRLAAENSRRIASQSASTVSGDSNDEMAVLDIPADVATDIAADIPAEIPEVISPVLKLANEIFIKPASQAEFKEQLEVGQAGLFELPILLKENTEEALLMAGTSLPMRSAREAVERAAEFIEQNKAQFEISAETVVAPIYPFKARRQRLEGHVRLEFSVNESGKAENIVVVDAQPADIFEKSAISALEKWRFKVVDGISENHRLYQAFDFGMEETEVVLPKRERRCDITGSRICGLQSYNDKK